MPRTQKKRRGKNKKYRSSKKFRGGVGTPPSTPSTSRSSLSSSSSLGSMPSLSLSLSPSSQVSSSASSPAGSPTGSPVASPVASPAGASGRLEPVTQQNKVNNIEARLRKIKNNSTAPAPAKAPGTVISPPDLPSTLKTFKNVQAERAAKNKNSSAPSGNPSGNGKPSAPSGNPSAPSGNPSGSNGNDNGKGKKKGGPNKPTARTEEEENTIKTHIDKYWTMTPEEIKKDICGK